MSIKTAGVVFPETNGVAAREKQDGGSRIPSAKYLALQSVHISPLAERGFSS